MDEIKMVGMSSAADVEKAMIAREVAEVFVEIFGGPCTAEVAIPRLVSENGMNATVFWQAVSAFLAQIKEKESKVKRLNPAQFLTPGSNVLGLPPVAGLSRSAGKR